MKTDQTTRRSFLASSSGMMSLAAFSHLNAKEKASSANTGLHHVASAKHVIYLFMSGGPSHVDTFDNKPELDRLHGEPIPESFVNDVKFAMIPDATRQPLLQQSPFSFKQYGESGIAVSSLLPNISNVVDRLTVIRSLHSEVFNHDPAVNLLNTGDSRVGRPTIGAWASYGLGNVTDDMPAYIVLTSGVKRQPLLTSYWSSGFLPTQHQGVEFRNTGSPILNLSNPDGISRKARHAQINLINKVNRRKLSDTADKEVETRIRQYELAFQMQASAPAIMDLTPESQQTLDQYGVDPNQPSFARNCLYARRLVESGVRFVQLYDMGWDSHGSLKTEHSRQCSAVDQPIAALIQDLDQRGLLDDTLVIWGGEFGRTPVIQGGGENWGRDHHPHGFTMFLAGGGSNPGTTYGATDEFGFHAVEDKVDVHDLHATILHLLGVDHHRLTYRHQGRDFRLTDVSGRVIDDLIKQRHL